MQEDINWQNSMVVEEIGKEISEQQAGLEKV